MALSMFSSSLKMALPLGSNGTAPSSASGEVQDQRSIVPLDVKRYGSTVHCVSVPLHPLNCDHLAQMCGRRGRLCSVCAPSNNLSRLKALAPSTDVSTGEISTRKPPATPHRIA